MRNPSKRLRWGYRTIVNAPKDIAMAALNTVKQEALPIAGGAVLGFGTPWGLQQLLKLVAKVPAVGLKIESTVNNKWVFPWARIALIAGLGAGAKKYVKQPILDKAFRYALILNAALLARSYIQNLLPSQYTGFLSGATESEELMNPELTQEEGFELEGLAPDQLSGLQSEGMNGLQQEGMGGLLPEKAGVSGLENVDGFGLGDDETPELDQEDSGIL